MALLDPQQNKYYNPGKTTPSWEEQPQPGSPYSITNDYGVFSNLDDEINAYQSDYDILTRNRDDLQKNFDRGLANRLKDRFKIDYSVPQEDYLAPGAQMDPVTGQYRDEDIRHRDNPKARYEKDQATDTLLGQALDAQLAAIRPKLEAARERKVFGETEGLLAKTRKKEDDLRAELYRSQNDFLARLDQRLQLGLQDAGVKAGEARALTGAAIAQHGLSRSTLGSRALNEITSAEQEQKGNLRAESNKIGNQIRGGTQNTLDVIENKRRTLEINRDLSELRSFQDIGFQIDTQAIKDQFANQIANAELEANDKSMWLGLAGGILGGGAKLLGGAL